MHRIDDDARQPRRIEHALFEVELPGAVLLRHQPALQPVGEPRHHALQMRQLLVEIAAQAVEFLRLAQLLGGHDLVEPDGERPVVRPARLVLAGCAAATARPAFPIAHLGVVGHVGRGRVTASSAVFRRSSAEASASSMLIFSMSSDSEASPFSPFSSLRRS